MVAITSCPRASPPRTPKAKDLSINLQEKLLAAFPQRYPGLGMAVIDACRTSTNDKVGAFNYSTAPEGCIMAFSASAGQVSLSPADPDKNSFYTQELVGALNDVDEETPITDIFEFTRRRVEKTMTNHPEAAVRQLAQRPHMTSGRTGMFVLGRARAVAVAPNAEDDAYAQQAAAILPGDVKKSAKDFLQDYPNSRYNAQIQVALSGAEDALRALSSPFVRLSVSAFQTAKGDELFMTDLRKALRGDKDAAERISLMYRNGHSGFLKTHSVANNGYATQPCSATPLHATSFIAVWQRRVIQTPSSSARVHPLGLSATQRLVRCPQIGELLSSGLRFMAKIFA
jgi:hypothetical protein